MKNVPFVLTAVLVVSVAPLDAGDLPLASPEARASGEISAPKALPPLPVGPRSPCLAPPWTGEIPAATAHRPVVEVTSPSGGSHRSDSCTRVQFGHGPLCGYQWVVVWYVDHFGNYVYGYAWRFVCYC